MRILWYCTGLANTRKLTKLNTNGGKSSLWNRRTALLGGGALVLGAGWWVNRQQGEAPVRYLSSDSATLHRGNGAEPLSIDPAFVQGEPEENLTGDLNVGLVTYDPAARPIPGIAESWTSSPDGLVWTFHLREARWSDGAPLTAEDFVFGWRRLLDAKTASVYA